MRRVTLAAAVLSALAIQGLAGQARAAEPEAEAEASAVAPPGVGAVPVAPSEQALLAAQEAQAPQLQEAAAAGCEERWFNDEQRTRLICGNPVQKAIGGALVGGLVGGLLSGPPGILIGAPIGALLGYVAEGFHSGF